MPHRVGWFYPEGGWLAILTFVLFIVLVAWLISSLIRGRDHRSAASHGQAGAAGLEEADAILRARFARGEITAEEYQQARRVLGLP